LTNNPDPGYHLDYRDGNVTNQNLCTGDDNELYGASGPQLNSAVNNTDEAGKVMWGGGQYSNLFYQRNIYYEAPGQADGPKRLGEMEAPLELDPQPVTLQPPPRCAGVEATIVGTSAGEVINGTAGGDVIVGLGGNDTINGLAGNDRICGGNGADKMIGGSGADIISGQAGVDVAHYGSRTTGVTVTLDNAANDGNSDDGLAGARDNVRADTENVNGGSGADTLTGSGGKNSLAGNSGADVFNGLGGIDTVTYFTRNVGITVDIDGVADDGNANDGPAGARDNVMPDVENLSGGDGADTLRGSPGVNVLRGGAGTDSLFGLGGNDVLFANDGAADSAIDCDGGATDVAHVDPGDPATVGCETVGP
jgi:Ca2+-binding RTX toxin-like protein